MNLKGKKVIGTGFCGFIGNTFTKLLLDEDPADILVIDKVTYVADRKFHDASGICVIEADIASSEAAKIIAEYKPDIIVNMAAESHVDVSIKDPDIFLRSNVCGTTNLLNASLKLETLPLFVQISTDEVYGDIEHGASVETDQRKASSPYSASKAAAELFVESYGRTFGLHYLITRSSNNYGAYQHTEKFVPKIISNLLQGKKVPIYGDGKQERNWIYVDDNCGGIITAIHCMNIPNDIFNIGGCRNYTNLEIVSKICSLLNKPFEDSVIFVQDRPGHDKRYALSSTKLEDQSWWYAATEIYEGLQETVNWYMSRLC